MGEIKFQHINPNENNYHLHLKDHRLLLRKSLKKYQLKWLMFYIKQIVFTK